MSNNKCAGCGLLNFASASVCKRCKATLNASSEFGEQRFFGGHENAWQEGYPTVTNCPQPAYQSPYFTTPVAPLPRTSKNGGANAVLFVLLGVAVSVAASIGVLWKFGGKPAVATLRWQEYKADDGSFTVEMPTKPVESVRNQPTVDGEIQIHALMGNMNEQGIYIVGYTDYPAAWPEYYSTDEMLDLAAEDAVNRSGSTLVSQKSISLGSYPGMEVEMIVPPDKIPDGGRLVCRVYWDAPRMYVVIVGGPESSEVYETRTKFLDSFKLRKKHAQ